MERSLDRKSFSKRHERRLRNSNVSKALEVIQEDLEVSALFNDFSPCTAAPFVIGSSDIRNKLSQQSTFVPQDEFHETKNDSMNQFAVNTDNYDNNSHREFQSVPYVLRESSSDTDSSSNEVSGHGRDFADIDDMKDDLRKWACDNNITHNALGQLLKVLRPKIPNLPVDARTLLSTPKHVEITPMDNGHLCYFGLQRGLQQKLKLGMVSRESNVIKLDFNVDGLPLFKSSSQSLWPILCRSLSLIDNTPFVVALFSGTEKPKPLDIYLEKFITELQVLVENGIDYENELFEIQIRCFICDAPARAMMKIVSGHTSSFGCEKCFSKAHCVNRKLCYPVNDSPRERTDCDFTRPDTSTNNHIRGKSPLLKINVKLVTQFPLDPLHLIFLGVTRRLLVLYWLEGQKERRKFKISQKLLRVINNKIQCIIRPNMTYEFPRKPRPLTEIKRWKATEFRMFLLYYGPIVMFHALNHDQYDHFLLLHVAITILSSRTLLVVYLRVAEDLLEKFVSLSASMYGPDFVVYNVHSLRHLSNEVRLYGPLCDFSSFPFENYMSILKRFVRAKRLPLQQIAHRLAEINSLNIKHSVAAHGEDEYKPHKMTASTGTSFQCESLSTPKFKISANSPNNVVVVGKKIFEIHTINFINGRYKIIGKPYTHVYNLYRKPIPSSEIGIYFVKKFHHSRTFFVDEISYKCLRFPFKDGYAIFPILHQSDNI